MRSSAIDEDGPQHSFAGQYDTYLHVPFSAIEEKIVAVWRSVTAGRAIKYREMHNLPHNFGIGVIVQEMVNAQVAGVAFGANPVTKDPGSKVISAVYGLGEGLVSGQLNADTFTVTRHETETKTAKKTHAFIRDPEGNGIQKIEVEKEKQFLPTLNSSQIKEIATLLDTLSKEFGVPQDIEFAIEESKLYILQTRPITTLNKSLQGEYTLWDNSNIVESYPGITTPLTFSFIIKMYEMVYRQFVEMMGVKKHEIEKHAHVFSNTLGLVRGRVYYNLLNWYKMLAMLPGFSINAAFMERMMGVKERFVLNENYVMSKGLARWRIVTMVIRMFLMHLRLPKERRRFLKHLNSTMEHYRSIDFKHLAPPEIIACYNSFEETLLLQWKAPLINDFFAMIWFGLFENKTKQLCPNEPNMHNSLLCGSKDIVSVEPIYRSMRLATMVAEDKEAKKLFMEATPDAVWQWLCAGNFPRLKTGFDEYIRSFGYRCVGELKLETISYAENPALLVKVIQQYVAQGITKKMHDANIEEDLRLTAENKVSHVLKGKPVKRWWFNYLISKTRDLVSNRENLRYERTRGFGMVRNMFNALGWQWHQMGHLANPRDIFYLELAEIKSMANGFNEACRQKLSERKEAFARFAQQPPPQERFFTYGHNFSDEYIYSLEKIEAAGEELRGTGCCPGVVKGKVRVVTDPNETASLHGDILVTSSTDPGWVTLFPTASAIVVERGSLLSHSAIVSREMGIPCIVSVAGLLRTLKTGDEVIMDGSTGIIKILKNAGSLKKR
ncbi:MAG: phosphoenolpyruvate synthase [Bacteroidales bacterium]|nr:phosphoenolpyruvate synthase [Bacteroidales bacterium]